MAFVSKIDRSGRRQKTAEDFTPQELVDMMLDKLPPDMFTEKKNFLDPAAGNGNIIVEIVKRKIVGGLSYSDALKTTFAIELLSDNVNEMKDRVWTLVRELCPDAKEQIVMNIMNANFVCHDAMKWDFDNWRPKQTSVQCDLFG